MTPELLYKIADVINENSDIFFASVPNMKKDYMLLKDGKLVKTCCLVLNIKVMGKTRNPVKRSSWNIYENDIDRIIRKMSWRDADFAERMKSCALSPFDVEMIVRRASFQSVKLKIAHSPYYFYVNKGI